ncbi:MAG TPA: histidine phosphatase family protein [Patescibacteria group bacterium]|jgi:phosphohistidine phosphatase|nr:histidine phosphatase family protein [Patescibacteria group bacterium]
MTVALHFLRHAHAGDPLKWHGDDAERPLSGKGRDQADRLARMLEAIGFETDAILTSPKLRAQQTAEPVALRLGTRMVVDDRLAGPVTLAALERILADAGGPSKPVIVGHDPDFSELVALLVGASELPMRKGAFARVDLAHGLAPGTGVLRWLIPPELVPGR